MQPTASFAAKKARILQQLSLPDAEYADASPKGSVDAPIRTLIDEINRATGFVTTSSCSGRVSVFLDGESTPKGAGGAWLYVSHEPPPPRPVEEWIAELGLSVWGEAPHEPDEARLIHLKFEPMILHVLTCSPAHAQLLLRCALQAGFRESGAVNVGEQGSTPMVAVRSMGMGLESLIGYEDQRGRRRIVQPEYLRMLLDISRQRFAENESRIERFRSSFARELAPSVRRNPEGKEWEDPAIRRERMKAEGLRRKAALQEQSISLT